MMLILILILIFRVIFRCPLIGSPDRICLDLQYWNIHGRYLGVHWYFGVCLDLQYSWVAAPSPAAVCAGAKVWAEGTLCNRHIQ